MSENLQNYLSTFNMVDIIIKDSRYPERRIIIKTRTDELHRLKAYDKGKEDKSKEVAKAMLAKDYKIDKISSITGLTTKEIKAIEKELKSDNN